jgi:hypothetical protein
VSTRNRTVRPLTSPSAQKWPSLALGIAWEAWAPVGAPTAETKGASARAARNSAGFGEVITTAPAAPTAEAAAITATPASLTMLDTPTPSCQRPHAARR